MIGHREINEMAQNSPEDAGWGQSLANFSLLALRQLGVLAVTPRPLGRDTPDTLGADGSEAFMFQDSAFRIWSFPGFPAARALSPLGHFLCLMGRSYNVTHCRVIGTEEIHCK